MNICQIVFLGCLTGFDPVLTVSQTAVQSHYTIDTIGTTGRNRTSVISFVAKYSRPLNYGGFWCRLLESNQVPGFFRPVLNDHTSSSGKNCYDYYHLFKRLKRLSYWLTSLGLAESRIRYYPDSWATWPRIFTEPY